MISRRGLFGLLAGLASTPALAPLAKLFPAVPAYYRTYLLPREWISMDPAAAIGGWSPCRAYLRGDRVSFSGGKTHYPFIYKEDS